MTSSRFSIRLLILSVAFLACAGFHVSAQPSLDLSFDASLTRVPTGDVRGIFPQPDGKIFVTGAFKAAGGKSRSAVVKLNADGTVDPSFYGPEIRGNEPTFPARVFDLALQSTGKVLIGGEFNDVDGQAKYRLIRLNPDGSLDNTFAPQPLTWVVQDLLVLPDDKILVGGGFQYSHPSGPRNQLVRLNADGTLDTSITFSPEPEINVSRIIRQADGKLVVAYGTKVVRYTTTGALDPTFGPIVANQDVVALALQPDGRIVIGGGFTSVNGFSVVGIFRTSSDGVIDASFSSAAPNGSVLSIDVAADGRIAVGGTFTFYGNVARKRSAVLDVNGNLLDTYNPSTNPILTVYATAFQADGKVFIGGQGDQFASNPMLVRANTDGSIDSGFNALIGFNGIGGRIRMQPDGKILVSGLFRNSNLVNRASITRFNIDGTLDTGFTPPSNLIATETTLTGLDLFSDGKVATDGLGPNNTFQIALRLNANGTLLQELSADQRPRDIRVLANDQFLIGAGSHLRRYNSNGTIDGTFSPTIVGDIYRVILQPDGKILIGGNFTQVNGNTRSGVARLNSDGTIDATFSPAGGANGLVADLALQADGKLLIAGEFTGVNFDTNRKYLARLNSNGSLDSGYAPVLNAPVYALKVQPDGRLLIGGDMTLVNGVPRTRFARLNTNGSLETTFNISVNDTVLTIELQADGKIIYGGEFTRTNGMSTVGIGRLLNPAIPAITRTPFDFDGDGRADISVFRPSTNRWYEALSSGPVAEETFGSAGDIVTPADFDGDGKTDEAIFRPSNGQWWYKSSINGAVIANVFGQNGDIPRPSDFDSDGKADLVLFRPSNNTWYRFGTASGPSPEKVFGSAGDQPLVGDFDGDGKSDLAVFRPSSGDWWYAASSANDQFRTVHWGQNGDIPVPADFDGDGKTDYAVYRPSEGGWYIFNSSNGSFTTMAFGLNGDRPVAADYDGDGRADIAVFRPSTGIWYLLQSTSGFIGYQFGISTDTALPGSLIP